MFKNSVTSYDIILGHGLCWHRPTQGNLGFILVISYEQKFSEFEMNNFIRPPMDLKQFMLRQQVLKLYRDILRTIKQVPSKEDQKELKTWARNDFQNNKNLNDEMAIKMMMKHGERCLKELKQSLDLCQ